MTHRLFFFLKLAVFLPFLVATSLVVEIHAEEQASLPNIVFMFADDLGYADLGCYGHPYAKTQYIDQLANEGTRFTQFYVTGVTCNPSRTGLMTGRHPARFRKYAADFGFAGRVTITELLKERGYSTGHFGKWHMGPVDAPGTYGIEKIDTIGKSQDRSLGRDTDLYTEAIKFIRSHKDGPFYINIWGHATHYAVDTPKNLASIFSDVKVTRQDFSATMQHKFKESAEIDPNLDDSMQQYLGDVYQIDQNVGRVMAVLEELGLAENTIVVFSSDHGPAPVGLANKGIREFSKNMLGYAGELRGGKHSQFEGGVRVPFIIRWPEKVKAGHVDSVNVGSFIDWLPTLCSLAGIDALPTGLDGEDISDMWLGATRKRTTPLFWKTSAAGGAPSMREGQWKLHLSHKQKGGCQLYDLLSDPSESKNVIDEFPEIATRMRKDLRRWVAELPEKYVKKENR